ncbi:5-formyltetrahydrofolate cyclo-ligase [Nesterenkonia haasae]|uniref:5-formyltetrahydrofolate cyclo-ligase n=1 Tax=Nesterenkonia haasae TaxID=2587813 RepID=UPI0038B38646
MRRFEPTLHELHFRSKPVGGPVEQDKRTLRAETRRSRRSHSTREREALTEGLTQNLVSVVRAHEPALVACYLSTPDEPNTRPFLEWAVGHSVDVLLPVSRPDGQLNWVFNHAGTEKVGLYGIAERAGEPVPNSVIESVDLMIIPAAAVDKSGVRLGWGKGYYDRTLAQLTHEPPIFAVVYDGELRERIPREDHDRPVGGVVTPTQILTFG